MVDIVREKGHLHLEEPVKLASGDWSRDYIDGKRAFAHGADLRLASEALLRLAREEGWEFDAVGGLTLGADQFRTPSLGSSCVRRKRTTAPSGGSRASNSRPVHASEFSDTVAFVIVGEALSLVGAPWEEDEQGVPESLARRVDVTIRRHLPGIVSERDPEAQLALAQTFREAIQLALR